jgi:predicted AlkP superfamily pyrophosphatase or phosphodiesterase
MMKRFPALLLALSLALAPAASAYDGHPKIVIILVIDQFRADYLDRYRADFKTKNGFRLFLDKGAYFPECYYDYANTKTAPGHATIGTGAYTEGHGIQSNEWWDLARNKQRQITSVEDDRYRIVGAPDASIPALEPNAPAGAARYLPGASPRNLLASTVGDELRLATQGEARVFGVSLKDRAAILPSGATANAAYWIEQKSGHFVTSSFYLAELPEWVKAFNDGPDAATAATAAQVPGTTQFYDEVGRTPAANTYELAFAEALISGEQLGKRDVPDLITISLSANDILGHRVGPDSDAEHQMVDALDVDLDAFFSWLDKNVDGGLGNVWVALTADHGVAPIPSKAAALGLNAAAIDTAKLTANLNDAMNQKFSPGEKIDYMLPKQELPYLTLNEPMFARAGINEPEAETAVEGAVAGAVDALAKPAEGGVSDTKLPPKPMLYRSYTRLELAKGEVPRSEFGSLLEHSYSPNGGWYVMVIPTAYQLESSGGTTHYSPWSYDRHVPLGFYGAPFAPGVYRERAAPVDLAATFASLLGVNQPSASIGHVLVDALKPASAVVYPKPVIKPAPGKPSRRRRAQPGPAPDTTPK